MSIYVCMSIYFLSPPDCQGQSHDADDGWDATVHGAGSVRYLVTVDVASNTH